MLLMLTILEKPSMFLALDMIFLLSGEILLLFFFQQFCAACSCGTALYLKYCSVPEILLCTRNTALYLKYCSVPEIQL